MRVLVVGGRGREHAIVRSLFRTSLVLLRIAAVLVYSDDPDVAGAVSLAAIGA